jgi:hypothetical protein
MNSENPCGFAQCPKAACGLYTTSLLFFQAPKYLLQPRKKMFLLLISSICIRHGFPPLAQSHANMAQQRLKNPSISAISAFGLSVVKFIAQAGTRVFMPSENPPC